MSWESTLSGRRKRRPVVRPCSTKIALEGLSCGIDTRNGTDSAAPREGDTAKRREDGDSPNVRSNQKQQVNGASRPDKLVSPPNYGCFPFAAFLIAALLSNRYPRVLVNWL